MKQNSTILYFYDNTQDPASWITFDDPAKEFEDVTNWLDNNLYEPSPEVMQRVSEFIRNL